MCGGHISVPQIGRRAPVARIALLSTLSSIDGRRQAYSNDEGRQ